jgi:hypothetical protein
MGRRCRARTSGAERSGSDSEITACDRGPSHPAEKSQTIGTLNWTAKVRLPRLERAAAERHR